MDELVAWYRQQLDDDARAARAATRGPWRATETMVWVGDTDETVAAYSDYYMDDAYDGPEMSGLNKADAAHIARHDPAAVLADVAAKRAILDAYLPDGEDPHPGQPCTNDLTNDPDGLHYSPWDSCDRHIAASKTRIHNGLVIRLLASAYRHRPGWKNKWEA